MKDLNLIIKDTIELFNPLGEHPDYKENPLKQRLENPLAYRWVGTLSNDDSLLKVGDVYRTTDTGYVILPFNMPLNIVNFGEDKIVGKGELEELNHTFGCGEVNTVIIFKVLELYRKPIEKKHLVNTL